MEPKILNFLVILPLLLGVPLDIDLTRFTFLVSAILKTPGVYMFKHSLIILKNAIIVSTVLFIFSLALDHIHATQTESYCFGIACQEIACPDDYMIKVQDGTYVKCEQLQEYLEGQ